MMKKIFIFLMPWPIRRLLLNRWMKYEIHPSATIGFSWIYPGKLIMHENARIGHLNIAIHLDKMELGVKSSIARGNWITGFTTNSVSKHFQHQKDRTSFFCLGDHSAITKNHHIDCTSSVIIGNYTTIAGYQSQLLTHSIDVYSNRQDSKPIKIGDYCFLGTNVVLLGGSSLPSNSVLGAKSLLNKSFTDEWMLYGGVSAIPIKSISRDAKYFTRVQGFVF